MFQKYVSSSICNYLIAVISFLYHWKIWVTSVLIVWMSRLASELEAEIWSPLTIIGKNKNDTNTFKFILTVNRTLWSIEKKKLKLR